MQKGSGKGEPGKDGPETPSFVEPPDEKSHPPQITDEQIEEISRRVITALETRISPKENPDEREKEKFVPPTMPMPLIMNSSRAGIDDAASLPGTISELSDPFRSAVLVQLGTFLANTLATRRIINQAERRGLISIIIKLQQLQEECNAGNRTDISSLVAGYLENLQKILAGQRSTVSSSPKKIKPPIGASRGFLEKLTSWLKK